MLAQSGLGQPNLAALGTGLAIPEQDIVAGVYSNTQTFFAPLLAAQAAQNIGPALFDEGDQFYALTFDVEALAGQILVNTFTETNLFYGPLFVSEAALVISVAYFDEGDQFYAPMILGDATIQDMFPLRFVNVNEMLAPQIVVSGKEPEYTYPIGHGLYSDYGIRASMTSYKRRMIIGRR